MEWETCFHVKTLGIASSSCLSHLFFFNSPWGWGVFSILFMHSAVYVAFWCSQLPSRSVPSSSPPSPSTGAETKMFPRNQPLEHKKLLIKKGITRAASAVGPRRAEAPCKGCWGALGRVGAGLHGIKDLQWFLSHFCPWRCSCVAWGLTTLSLNFPSCPSVCSNCIWVRKCLSL